MFMINQCILWLTAQKERIVWRCIKNKVKGTGWPGKAKAKVKYEKMKEHLGDSPYQMMDRTRR